MNNLDDKHINSAVSKDPNNYPDSSYISSLGFDPWDMYHCFKCKQKYLNFELYISEVFHITLQISFITNTGTDVTPVEF